MAIGIGIGIGRAAVLVLLVLLVAGPLRSQAPGPNNSIAEEYDRLLASGCDPAAFGIATAIEARVLRNLPFARAGLRLRSEALTSLYAVDGVWYQPKLDQVELAAHDQTCVQRLAEHETEVRGQLPIAVGVEAVLIGNSRVFWALRSETSYPNRYRNARSEQQPGLWSWGFQDASECGGDGSPEAADDCAGLAVICTESLTPGAEAALHCELIWAG